MKRFKRPKPGGQISARQLGELQRAVEAMMHPAGVSGARTGAVPAFTRGGVIHDSSVYQPFWAKLTSKKTDLDGATCYAFQEIYKDPASVTQTHTIGRSGDGQTIRSYEVRGIDVPQADIDAGRAIVLLWLGYDGPPGTYYLFWYGSGAGNTANVQTATHNSQQNNFVLNSGTTWLQINATGAFALTGLAVGWQGRIVQITNVGSASIELPHLSSASTSYASASESAAEGTTPTGNQLYIRTGCSAFLQPGESTMAKYVDFSSAGIKNVWVIEPFPTHVGGVAIKTGTAYTATQDDHGKLLVFTNPADITLTLPSSPYPSCDWFIDVWNAGTTETTLLTATDGTLTVYVLPSQGTRIFSTGAGYRLQNGSTNFNFVDIGDAGATLSVVHSGALLSFNPTSANRVCALPNPGTLLRAWSCTIENRGTKQLLLVPAAGAISGLSTLSVLPRTSVTIFTDRSNYFVARGRPPGGVTEISASTYTISTADHGRILVYTGTGTLSITGDANLPPGFRCSLRNKGVGTASLIQYARAGGGVDPIPPYRGYDLFVPDSGDTATLNYANLGMSLHGVRTWSSAAETVTRADCARELVYTGSTDTILSLLVPDSDDALFAVLVRNLSANSKVTIVRTGGALIDGQTTLTLKPCEGVPLYCDGTNWYAVRGRMCAGVIETAESAVTISPRHHGKILVYTGSSTCTITGDGSLPAGFRCGIRNRGTDPASLVLYTRAGGGVDPIPPFRAYNLYVPDTGDTASTTYADMGLSLYGVRLFTSSTSVTRADCSRNLVYTGSGGATLTLFTPDSDDALFAIGVRNLSSDSSVLTVATSGGRTIDGESSITLRRCEGVWIFSDGTNWYTVPGRVCDGFNVSSATIGTLSVTTLTLTDLNTTTITNSTYIQSADKEWYNHIINSGMELAQRQAPGTATTITSGGYGPDGWRVEGENAAVQYQRIDVSGISEAEANYGGRFSKITSTGKLLVYQIVEGVESMALRNSPVIRFAFRCRASTSMGLRIAVAEWSGTKDSVAATLLSAWGSNGTDPTWNASLSVSGGTPNDATASTTYDVTFSDSISGGAATLNNLVLMIWTNNQLAAGDWFEITRVSCGRNLGALAARYNQQRPSQQELALCQRRYQKSFVLTTAPASSIGANTGEEQWASAVGATTTTRHRVNFPVIMRVAPTITTYNPEAAGAEVRNQTGAADCSATATANVNERGFLVTATTDGAASAGQQMGVHYTAAADL